MADRAEAACDEPGFRLYQTDARTAARRGILSTRRGEVRTPVFMPVGTQATVKAMTPRELQELGVEIVLGNTYHLSIRPGLEVVRAAGGLHSLMGWTRPILTDSGGYQVFSLAKLRKIEPDGVRFQSHVDGASLFLGPREAMSIQRELGSDIAMVFDECTPFPCTREEARASLDLTLRWAGACRSQPRAEAQSVFGIVQGGMFRDLREHCAQALTGLDFDGYAVGGLSVGEPAETMFDVLDWVTPLLPASRPRYLMGVGTPPQVVEAVARGIDMFDCVLPTRVARNGSAYTADGCLPVKAGRFKDDMRPIEDGCQCYACLHFSRAYIRHLINVNEILGHRLMTIHNLHFYMQLMAQVRQSIEAGSFAELRSRFVARYTAQANAGDA